MLLQILLFEIKYRLHRPAFYLYFVFAVALSALNFGFGSVPIVEKEWINAPAVLAVFSSAATILLMLASSSIMGVPLYRDIEHNTKEYYLSYPITKAGYFWGRWLGSFFFVVLISFGVYLGIYLGCKLGPALGWIPADRYGPNRFYFYLQPFLTIVLPSMFFTSSLFFGLVAVFRNVKVIYSSGMFLFLGYILANFFMNNIHNPKVIYLADPFLMNGLRMQVAGWPPERLNTSVVPLDGLILTNRIIWMSVGTIVLLLTYWRFSFQRFFSGDPGRRTNTPADTVTNHRKGIRAVFRKVQVNLKGAWFRKTLFSLTRIELLNIIRDNYFWIILSGGLIFLSFVFWHGPGGYGVHDYPRTAFFMNVFGNVFGFFVFFIIIFYTGETMHRERVTRFAFINDALPPPTWMLNLAKLISLCCLAVFLSLIPMLIGLGVQLSRAWYHFNFPLYFTAWSASLLPQMLEMVLFSYTVHILVNHKFAAHAVGIIIWILMALVVDFHYFDYNLLLFGHTPFTAFSDMDGIGHMLRPVLWFHGYWLIAGALMIMLSSLFYTRGVSAAFGEKRRLASQRFSGTARLGTFLLLAVFLAAGAFIYYNVSYLNEYLTRTEVETRKAITEKKLKHYGDLPLPRVIRYRLSAEMYPSEQRVTARAWVTITNKGDRAIDSLLLDGDNLTEYDLHYNGQLLSFTNPLSYPRGKFNFFSPAQQPSDYRLYILPATLHPGDTAEVEIHSVVAFHGFRNDLYAVGLLHNGIVSNGGLPGLGYDDDEELGNNDVRRTYGLPAKHEIDIPHDDAAGRRTLESGVPADLVSLDITVSTAGDQWALAPGTLEKEWSAGGRHYFHYVQDHPRIYLPFGIASAHYSLQRDTVTLQDGRRVGLEVAYHPDHTANVSRFMTALKDGVRSWSQQFGPYPFGQMRLVEVSCYGPSMSASCQTILNTERVGWNVDMREPGTPDYIYYNTAGALAKQWWGQQVAPNHTVGAKVISDGLSKYAALLLMKKKYGEEGLNSVLQIEKNDYRWRRETGFHAENDLLHANRWFLGGPKTALVLYGLQGLMGADSLDAALRDFKEKFAFRDGGIYAGSDDLYQAISARIPDSLRYFLEDSWKRTTLYDLRLMEAAATPLGQEKYKVTIKLEVNKYYTDSTGKEKAATGMNDYLDIGVYGARSPLYLQRHQFTAGSHVLEIIVQGKPVMARIDPHSYLIDLQQEDNFKPIP